MIYELMLKNTVVLRFNTSNQTVQLVNELYVPIQLWQSANKWDDLGKFLSQRYESAHRSYISNLYDYYRVGADPLNTALACNGISYYDHYWIREKDSKLTWEDVNCFDNRLDTGIAKLMLFGYGENTSPTAVSPELSVRGMGRNCIARHDDDLYLVKRNLEVNLNSELLAGILWSKLDRLSKPLYNKVQIDCNYLNAIKLFTNQDTIFWHASDMKHAHAEIHRTIEEIMMDIDPIGFLKLVLFDYVVCNYARSEDSYGLMLQGNYLCTAPNFNLDHAFTIYAPSSIYPVFGMPFNQMLSYLYQKYKGYFSYLNEDFETLDKYVNGDGLCKFRQFELHEFFNETIDRIRHVLQFTRAASATDNVVIHGVDKSPFYLGEERVCQ